MATDFVPPGPGHWMLDRSHYVGGATPLVQWLIENSVFEGTSRVFREIGVPTSGVDARFVNGFMYSRVRPLLGGDAAVSRLPPAFVLKAVSRLHPELRFRERRARKSLLGTESVAVAGRWDQQMHQSVLERNRGFQQVEIQALSDGELQAHLSELIGYVLESFELHFWLHGHDLGPVALYVDRCQHWGIPPAESVKALVGASPSTVEPAETLWELQQMVEASGRDVVDLDDVRSISPDAESVLDRYLLDRGQILTTGYDVTSLTLAELPEVVLRSILAARPPEHPDYGPIAKLLSADVPSEDQGEFDRLLGQARSVMDMRDSNGPMTTEWPLGILRGVLLEIGRRLVASEKALAPEDVFEMTEFELRAVFGPDAPPGSELAERRRMRTLTARLSPPESLGDPEVEPDPSLLPESLARLVAVLQTAIANLGMDPKAAKRSLHGVGVGSASYIGTVCVTGSAEEALDRLEPGGILVVRATSPAFNAVLAIAGAIITADGGALSHAAVLARELDVPAIIGVPDALDIVDGSTVEVDPAVGVVRVISEPG